MPSLLLLLPAGVLALQAQPLTATEVSLGATAVMAHHTFVGGELGLAHRPSAESRIALVLAGGAISGEPAMRAQLTVQLLVNSLARSGAGVYAAVGGAFAGERGAPGQGFLALLLGVEGSPGRRKAWYVELGFAGGVRAAAGWRMRSFPRWWG